MNENIKHKNTLLMIWLLTLFVAALGTSFAYFKMVSKSEVQMIITKQLNMNIITKESTNLKNISPTTWSKKVEENNNNKNISKIHFTVSSTSKQSGTYQIDINSEIILKNDTTDETISDIKYKVYKGTEEINSGILKIGKFKKEIVSGIMKKNIDLNDTYILYIYIEENKTPQNKLQNISFPITLTGHAITDK